MFHKPFQRPAFRYIILTTILSLCVPAGRGAGSLQALIDTSENGAVVSVPIGVYAESVIIDKDLHLIASPGGVTLVPDDDCTDYTVVIKPGHTVTIEGFRFQPSSVEDAATVNGIRADGSTVNLIRCTLNGARQFAVFLDACTTVIDDCTIESSGKCGIHAEQGSMTVRNSVLTDNHEYGLYFSTGDNTAPVGVLQYDVTNNRLEGQASAITIQGNCSGNIAQNRFMDNDQTAVSITNAMGRADIIDNRISSSRYGIFIDIEQTDAPMSGTIRTNTCMRLNTAIVVRGTATAFEIMDNSCRNGDNHGIYLQSTGACRIIGNRCEENGAQGIYINHVKNEVQVENNNCLKNKRNGIYSTSSKAVITQNTCTENIYNGISIDCGFLDITANTCTDNQGSGIYLLQYIDGTISGNTLMNNRFYAIVRGTTKVLSTLEDNIMDGNLKGSIWQEETPYGGNCSYLLVHKQFDELNKIVTDFRVNRTRDEGGSWYLDYIYSEMASCWNNVSEEHPEMVIGLLKEWMQQQPESVAPYVVMAQVYVNIAWSHRGGGWAYEVDTDNWTKFRASLNNAVTMVHQAEKLAQQDPHLYSVLITAGMGLSSDRLAEEGFQKGILVDKYYPALYINKATTLLPRWGGRKGELEAFAAVAHQETADEPGCGMYARIIQSMHAYTYPDFDKFNFSYELIKQSHEDLLNAYPESIHYLNSYCMFACMNNDAEKAKELFTKIDGNYTYAVWQDQNNARHHYDWVYSKQAP